jgi:hypothetical protein
MRVFEQKLCEITESLSQHKADKLTRPKLIMRDDQFSVIGISDLRRTDLIVCNLGQKNLKDGLSSSTWGAVERFIRNSFKWQEPSNIDLEKEKKT